MLSQIPPALLALALAAGAAWGLSHLDPSARPDQRARTAAPADALRLYADAVAREPGNAYQWADLGDAYSNLDQVPNARACFLRAMVLSRDIPQIWLRDANFHFSLGEADAALQSAARVLEKVPDYDGILFSYFDRFDLGPARVLAAIGNSRRPSRSYLQFLLEHNQLEAASAAWRGLSDRGHLDDPLASSYMDALLRNQLYDAAQRDWSRYLGSRRDRYPDRNLLFNGGFEQNPSGCALDWRLQASDRFETSRDSTVAHSGKNSLKIHFSGTGNVSYDNVVQIAALRPGRYQLSYWVRADEITTNEGVRVEAFDLTSGRRLTPDTGPITGTLPWTLIKQELTLSDTPRAVAIHILRRPSAKFDNKVAGTLWFDDFVLGPA